jgi:hypothetical protein
VLAVISTALNFLYVHKEEEFVWLPALVWAVVLWQSFLGWWWWVGAGSGGGLTGKDDEVEEKLKRRAKRETRRKEAETKRQKRKEKAQQVWQGVAAALMSPHASPLAISSSVEVTQSNGDRTHSPEDAGESQAPQRRLRRQSSSHSFVDEEEPTSPAAGADSRSLASRPSSASLTDSTQETSGRTTSTVPRFMPRMLFRWYTSLRRAHIDAARLQAVERAERMRGVNQDRRRANTEDSETQGRMVDGWRCDWFPWRNLATSRTVNEGDEKPVGDDIYSLDDPENNGAERRRRRTLNEEPSRTNLRPTSFWWWGPLGRWRLQDSTTYYSSTSV